MTEDLRLRFVKRAGLPERPSVWELVETLREIPYGRPVKRSPEGVVEEWRGTCSTKHALLAELLADRPELDLRIIHRVYRLSKEDARDLFGEAVASTVPDEGLVDVHTYATVEIEGERVQVDVTFPSSRVWNGRSDMQLACGEGEDYPVEPGTDPWALKDELVAAHTDPDLREPFIAALAS